MIAGGISDGEGRGMERENPWRWEFELRNFRWADGWWHWRRWGPWDEERKSLEMGVWTLKFQMGWWEKRTAQWLVEPATVRTVGWRRKIHRDESLNFEISDGHLGFTRDESLNFESLDRERKENPLRWNFQTVVREKNTLS